MWSCIKLFSHYVCYSQLHEVTLKAFRDCLVERRWARVSLDHAIHIRSLFNNHSKLIASTPGPPDPRSPVVVVASRLDTDAGLAPVPPLGVVSVGISISPCSVLQMPSLLLLFDAIVLSVVVPDGVAGPQSNPLRDRAVLLLRLCELLLRAERLVGLQPSRLVYTHIPESVSATYRHRDWLP